MMKYKKFEMRKIRVFALLLLGLVSTNTIAQCDETFELCKKQLSKEDKKAGWFTNEQSEAVSAEKGKTYETTLTAHKGLEYRLCLCTDIDGGTAATFQLSQELVVTVMDSLGNSSMEKQRKVIFDNSIDSEEKYVLFRSPKTTKYFLSVNIPSSGKSKAFKSEGKVCVGVLLEHRRVKKSSL